MLEMDLGNQRVMNNFLMKRTIFPDEKNDNLAGFSDEKNDTDHYS